MKGTLPYLHFDGDCREAMRFYAGCLGAELLEMPWSGQCDGGAPNPDRLMHARLTRGGAIVLAASDVMAGQPYTAGNGFSVSLDCDSPAECRTLFDALAAGGEPIVEPRDMFWGAHFGLLRDRFGVQWMVQSGTAPAA